MHVMADPGTEWEGWRGSALPFGSICEYVRSEHPGDRRYGGGVRASPSRTEADISSGQRSGAQTSVNNAAGGELDGSVQNVHED